MVFRVSPVLVQTEKIRRTRSFMGSCSHCYPHTQPYPREYTEESAAACKTH